MTSVVAQGSTTMERATFRPTNSSFNTRATTKPISVDSPTTATTQMPVLAMTVPKASLETASRKLFRPIKPPTTPAREISLKESLKTMATGNTTKISISRMLGSSQR